jgi:phosphoribosylanthranilate isomerase
MVKVKICGLKRPEEVHTVAQAGGDAFGVVVHVPSSPRNISLEEAKELFDAAPPFISKVLVTIPRSMEGVKTLLLTNPDTLQLHGIGSIELLSRIRETVPCKLIIALSLNSERGETREFSKDPVKAAKMVAGYVDAVMIDTWAGDAAGGTGKTSDWKIVCTIRETLEPKPLILTGGLTPDNVALGIERVKPYAVDVSSGVEVKPGVKDPKLIKLFIQRAKEANRS